MTTTEPKQEVVKDTVTVTVDGITFEAPKGELLIKAAQEHGVYIPRFCWHERMKPVGMCRMCLVEVEGVRGFPPACTTPVAEGMVCNTQSDAVKKIQDGVLEFLLVNHPLDCPVCDRGGECPLQDQTLAFGPGESRFIEEKRHFEKPIPLSDLVLLDRERCIQCGRCTRFADEIAGDPLIDFVERGDRMQVLNFAEQPFDSYFSGNTVQICPVGALTAKPVPLQGAALGPRHGRDVVQRVLGAVPRRAAVVVEPARAACSVSTPSRSTTVGCATRVATASSGCTPSGGCSSRIRQVDGELREVSWPEALDAATALLRDALEQHGPESIALLGGARSTNEDAYAFAKLMKGVIGTDNVDAQIGDGLPAEVVLGLPRAQIADCDRAAAIVLLGPDLEEELPVLHLRVRRAAVELGVPLVDLAPDDARAVGARDRRRAHDARRRPRRGCARAHRATPAAIGPVRSLWCSVARRSPSRRRCPFGPRSALRDVPGVLFLSALRRGNVHGAIDSGLVPGFLPGRVSLDAGREWFESAWGSVGVPRAKGLDAQGILEAAAAGKIEVLVIFGADPIADFPDADLARAGYRRREAHDRDRRVPHRHVGARRCCAALHALGREDRQRHQPRRPRAARRPQGRARGHGDGRLAHRGRARAPARRRLRFRDRRRGHRRVGAGRARARRRRLRVAAPGPRRRRAPAQRARRRDRAAHARALDPRRRRFRHVVGPDQGRGRSRELDVEVDVVDVVDIEVSDDGEVVECR